MRADHTLRRTWTHHALEADPVEVLLAVVPDNVCGRAGAGGRPVLDLSHLPPAAVTAVLETGVTGVRHGVRQTRLDRRGQTDGVTGGQMGQMGSDTRVRHGPGRDRHMVNC